MRPPTEKTTIYGFGKKCEREEEKEPTRCGWETASRKLPVPESF
jgi:hypothetical protein